MMPPHLSPAFEIHPNQPGGPTSPIQNTFAHLAASLESTVATAKDNQMIDLGLLAAGHSLEESMIDPTLLENGLGVTSPAVLQATITQSEVSMQLSQDGSHHKKANKEQALQKVSMRKENEKVTKPRWHSEGCSRCE
ncbi:hypothetical protein DXG01_000602 [Tephrocybe rancida]|nr:hypothetical protein DXG01_000602 [Tephrocybe rancida]